jgi:hypothetical protein
MIIWHFSSWKFAAIGFSSGWSAFSVEHPPSASIPSVTANAAADMIPSLRARTFEATSFPVCIEFSFPIPVDAVIPAIPHPSTPVARRLNSRRCMLTDCNTP